MDIKRLKEEYEDSLRVQKETFEKLILALINYEEAIKGYEDRLAALEHINRLNEIKVKEKIKEVENLKKKLSLKKEDISNKIYEYDERNKKVDSTESNHTEVSVKLEKKRYVSEKIDAIKENFIAYDSDKIKKLMRSTKDLDERKEIMSLIKEELTEETINIDEIYTLLVISVFMGCLKEVLDSSKYLRDVYRAKRADGDLIRVVDSEIQVGTRSKLDVTSRIYLGGNRGKIRYIDKEVLEKVSELIYEIFYGVIDKVIVTDNLLETCKNDNSYLSVKNGYLKLSDEKGNKTFLLVAEPICEQCGALHISQKSLKKLEKKAEGYRIENIDTSNL